MSSEFDLQVRYIFTYLEPCIVRAYSFVLCFSYTKDADGLVPLRFIYVHERERERDRDPEHARERDKKIS